MQDVGRSRSRGSPSCRPGPPARCTRRRSRSSSLAARESPGTRSARATAGRRRRCRATPPSRRPRPSRASPVITTPKTKIATAIAPSNGADAADDPAARGQAPRALIGRRRVARKRRTATSSPASSAMPITRRDDEHHPVARADLLGVRRVRRPRGRCRRAAGAAKHRERKDSDREGAAERWAGGTSGASRRRHSNRRARAPRAQERAPILARARAPVPPTIPPAVSGAAHRGSSGSARGRRRRRSRCRRCAARLGLRPAVTIAVAAAGPPALAVLRPRTRARDVALYALQMWGFTMAHEIPYDDPEALRRRLRIHYPIRPRPRDRRRRASQRSAAARARRPAGAERARPVPVDGPLGLVLRPARDARLRARSATTTWRPSERRFPRAARQMAATYDLGCVGYFAVPTAPPWWAAENGYADERGAAPDGGRRRAGVGRRLAAALRLARRQPVGGDAVAALRQRR